MTTSALQTQYPPTRNRTTFRALRLSLSAYLHADESPVSQETLCLALAAYAESKARAAGEGHLAMPRDADRTRIRVRALTEHRARLRALGDVLAYEGPRCVDLIDTSSFSLEDRLDHVEQLLANAMSTVGADLPLPFGG